MSLAEHYTWDAAEYHRFRPAYPEELFAYLARIVPLRETAWDCATGTGQAARGLARYFRRVVATDASHGQLRHVRLDGVDRAVCRAEEASIASRSIDLVTVAQALHWFADEAFFDEVDRVAKHGGVLAAWVYYPVCVSATVDQLVREFHSDIVGPYWPPERTHVEDEYRSIPFPFREMSVPRFTMTARWTLEQFLGYVTTWSAVKRARASQVDPVPEFAGRLERVWGVPGSTRTVTWPLHLRVGTVHDGAGATSVHGAPE